MDIFISKKRGAFLTIILYLIGILLIKGLFDTSSNTIELPAWLILKPITFKLILFLLNFALLWEIWFWKKWAIYSIIGLDIITTLILFSLDLPTTDVITALGSYIIVSLDFVFQDGLLYWAYKRKLKYFS